MNDSQPEFDPTLAARFRGEHAQVPDEPFVRSTLQRVAAARSRSTAVRRVMQAAALVAVIAASPWLIRGSVLLSDAMEQSFVWASTWFARPAGVAIVAIAAIAGIAFAWKARVFR